MHDDSHLGRTSLWSVPDRWSVAYLWIFASQTLIWLALLILRETTSEQPVNIVAQAVNVGIAWAPLMVVSAGVSMLIVEVPMVFADKYLNYRYRLGRQKGREEGREAGHEAGLEEGIAVGREEGREEGREAGREEGIEVGAGRERARWEQYADAVDEARRTGKPEPERPRASHNGSAND